MAPQHFAERSELPGVIMGKRSFPQPLKAQACVFIKEVKFARRGSIFLMPQLL